MQLASLWQITLVLTRNFVVPFIVSSLGVLAATRTTRES